MSFGGKVHILITGGCGYIGTQLTKELLKHEFQVTVVDIMWFGNYLPDHPQLKLIQADVRDVSNIPMEGIDAVLHLANVANDPCGELNTKLSWEVNTLATMALVEKASENKVQQFIYASSGSVYGIKEEEQVTEDLSLVPISDYNKTKMISERILLSYQNEILIQCIRPATVCGYSPRMRLDVSVNMLSMQALKGGKITVFGGNQVRPNIHIQDMIRVYLHFLELKDKAPGIYNAGFENMSILDIANTIVDKVPAEIVVTESNDPRSYRLNSDKLINTGFQPKYSVNEAIVEVIEKFNTGELVDSEKFYNLKTMAAISNLA